MVVHISLCVTMNYGKRISLLTSFLQSSVILKHLHHSLPVRNFVIKKCKWCWAWNFLTVCCYQFWLFLPSFKWYWFTKFPRYIFENHSTIQQNFPIFVWEVDGLFASCSKDILVRSLLHCIVIITVKL